MDIDPATGNIVFAVMSFQATGPTPKEWIKNGKLVKPVEHLVAIFDPEKADAQPIARSMSDEVAFSNPKVSPDGGAVLVTAGLYDRAGTNLEPKGLVSMPCKTGGEQAAVAIIQGPAVQASWHPGGQKITYIQRVDGKRAIFTAGKDGSSPRNVSGTGADYAWPQFSPQQG
jgi:hypothetical protein